MQPCGVDNSTTSCYVYLAGDTVETPPFITSVSACVLGATLKVNSTAPVLVGPASEGLCGGGDPAQFQQDLNALAASNATWLYIAGAVVAAFQFLLLGAALFAICCSKDDA